MKIQSSRYDFRFVRAYACFISHNTMPWERRKWYHGSRCSETLLSEETRRVSRKCDLYFRNRQISHQGMLWISTVIFSVIFVVPATNVSGALHEKMGQQKIPWHEIRRGGSETAPLEARRDGTERDGEIPSRPSPSFVPSRPHREE